MNNVILFTYSLTKLDKIYYALSRTELFLMEIVRYIWFTLSKCLSVIKINTF